MEVISNAEARKRFTIGSHHRNVTIAFISHIIFAQGKYRRSINLNIQDYILFKRNRDCQQIPTCNHKIIPANKQSIVEAYNDCESACYEYLLVELTAQGFDCFRMLFYQKLRINN